MPSGPRFDRRTISHRIDDLRRDKKMSKKELAVKAEIAVWAFYKKSRGGAPFHVEELERIARALDAPALFPILSLPEANLATRILARFMGKAPRS
jgi:transcriptional regulator with XRE-family HTH domain